MKCFFPFPQPGLPATFLNRPQRFLAEVRLPDGSTTIAYCSNPGAFTGCLSPQSPALLWDSGDTARKRRYTWRAIKVGRTWIGTDPHLANKLIEKALLEHALPGFETFDLLKREPRVPRGGRLDFLLTNGSQNCFVEVKSATIAAGGIAQFPDSVSPRAIEHLNSLRQAARAGQRAALIFLVQRNDVSSLTINQACDPAFNKAFARFREAGGEVAAFKHAVTPKGFGPPTRVPVRLE